MVIKSLRKFMYHISVMSMKIPDMKLHLRDSEALIIFICVDRDDMPLGFTLPIKFGQLRQLEILYYRCPSYFFREGLWVHNLYILGRVTLMMLPLDVKNFVLQNLIPVTQIVHGDTHFCYDVFTTIRTKLSSNNIFSNDNGNTSDEEELLIIPLVNHGKSNIMLEEWLHITQRFCMNSFE